MVNSEKVLNSTTWEKISSMGQDYVIQNIGTNRVLVKASSTMPTNEVGAIVLLPYSVMSSTILKGDIWVKATKLGNSTIVYAV